MNQEQLDQFKAAVTNAIQAHLASGGRLTAEKFTRDGNCKCPIACMIDVNNGASFSVQLSNKLGFKVTDSDMWEFVYGFDYSLSNGSNPKYEIYYFGYETRQKYLPAGLSNE